MANEELTGPHSIGRYAPGNNQSAVAPRLQRSSNAPTSASAFLRGSTVPMATKARRSMENDCRSNCSPSAPGSRTGPAPVQSRKTRNALRIILPRLLTQEGDAIGGAKPRKKCMQCRDVP